MPFTKDFYWVGETEKAICVTEKAEDFEPEDKIWIPLSQINEISGLKEPGAPVTVVMTDWIAEKKGW